MSIVKTLSDQRVEEDLPVTLECELSRQIVEVKWLKVRARLVYLFNAVESQEPFFSSLSRDSIRLNSTKNELLAQFLSFLINYYEVKLCLAHTLIVLLLC